MKGDINRDWKIVDWSWIQSNYGDWLTVSATVNSAQVRAYEFSTADMPPEAVRLLNDMLAALKQVLDEAAGTDTTGMRLVIGTGLPPVD